eukprot:tig00000691_g3166.t1
MAESSCRAAATFSAALGLPAPLLRRIKHRRDLGLLIELELTGAQLDALDRCFERETVAGGVVLQALASISLLPASQLATATPLVPLLGDAMAESRKRLQQLAQRVVAARAGLQERVAGLAEQVEQAATLADELAGRGCDEVADEKRALAGMLQQLHRNAAAVAAGASAASCLPGLHWRRCCGLADAALSDEEALCHWWEGRGRELLCSSAGSGEVAPTPQTPAKRARPEPPDADAGPEADKRQRGAGPAAEPEAPSTPPRDAGGFLPLPDHQASAGSSQGAAEAAAPPRSSQDPMAVVGRARLSGQPAGPSPGRQSGGSSAGGGSSSSREELSCASLSV